MDVPSRGLLALGISSRLLHNDPRGRPLTSTEARMTDEARRGGEGYVAGVRAGWPFALVVFVVAISFRVLTRSLCWGVLAPIVFSVITFSVGAQFAVAAVMGGGGGGVAARAPAPLF